MVNAIAVGHTASDRLLEFTIADQREAKNQIEDEDIGSIRNGPFQPCSGYFAYSRYYSLLIGGLPKILVSDWSVTINT